MKILPKAILLFLLFLITLPAFAGRPFRLVGMIGDLEPHYNPWASTSAYFDVSMRLFRPGGPGNTCDSPKPPPTQANVAGTFKRSLLSFNTTTEEQCITVKFHHRGIPGFGNDRYTVAAYSSGTSGDPKINLIGWSQEMVSETNPSSFFSFRKPAGNSTYFLAITSAFTGKDGIPYDVEISSALAQSSDFDGDGVTDSAVFRPSTGAWYILQSSNNTLRVDFFGTNGDVPMDGDFDGDSHSDLAVFRPSNGTWYYRRSSNGSFFGAFFGLGTDTPVPADYDNDGITDIAAFRPSTGQWFISPGTLVHSTVYGYNFGTAGDIPVSSQRK